MISTDEMSSTSMDISESFRPEDLSKTDFFDFVSASEIGIGVGIRDVGVGMTLQTSHHHYQEQHQQQQSQGLERLTTSSNMTHDGGGSSGRSNTNVGDTSISNGNNSESTLNNYEQFWPSEKDSSRLDPSIFEDFDRYCWQQQQQQACATTGQTHNQPANQTTNTTTHSSDTGSSVDVLNCDSSAASNNTLRSSTHNANPADGSHHISQHNNSTNTLTTTNVHNTDSQIYTITVLNGGSETAGTGTSTTSTWLKREPEETQIPTPLDLDSLLGNFSGYIKSEFPYDDSGFSTDGTKEGINGEIKGISIQQQHQEASTLQAMSDLNSNQALPPLMTAMSGGRACVNIGQELAAQFQNNNNDWHMIDHNAEQNSAESLLRSALQGKGYTKCLHQLQNSSAGLLPGSPNTKDDEMRRVFFANDSDTLAFADSTLNTSQIFEESQHQTSLIQLHNNTPASGIPPNGPTSHPIHTSNTSSSLTIDDMFLTLENAFSDDFDKMKRIANEVQQYCNTPSAENDYISSDIMMQISPTTTAGGTTTKRLQPLHSPVTTTPSSMVHLGPPSSSSLASSNTTHQHQHQQHQQQQHHKPEVTTVPKTATNAPLATTNNRTNATKVTKRYKRVSNLTNNNNITNNNPSATNNNNCTNNNSNTSSTTKNSSVNCTNSNPNTTSSSNCTQSSGGSSSSSSNSPPTPQCNGQRKERSLHYCSICSKGFKDKYSVNVHIRTHTGEKPFACSLCGKSFRQKAHLAKHYQTHMAQKNNHGTSIIKSNSSKHHRTATTAVASNAVASAAAAAAAQQRQLGMLASGSMPSQIGGNSNGGGGGNNLGLTINPNLLGVTSTVVTLNGPASSVNIAPNVLTPPSGLLANR